MLATSRIRVPAAPEKLTCPVALKAPVMATFVAVPSAAVTSRVLVPMFQLIFPLLAGVTLAPNVTLVLLAPASLEPMTMFSDSKTPTVSSWNRMRAEAWPTKLVKTMSRVVIPANRRTQLDVLVYMLYKVRKK